MYKVIIVIVLLKEVGESVLIFRVEIKKNKKFYVNSFPLGVIYFYPVHILIMPEVEVNNLS